VALLEIVEVLPGQGNFVEGVRNYELEVEYGGSDLMVRSRKSFAQYSLEVRFFWNVGKIQRKVFTVWLVQRYEDSWEDLHCLVREILLF
jgi:hypothetical protein